MQIMVEAYPVVVFTKQLEDGSRRIMEILEGEGFENGKLMARTLYKYEILDNRHKDSGEIQIIGIHRKVGQISDALQERMLDNGISQKELEEFIKNNGDKEGRE